MKKSFSILFAALLLTACGTQTPPVTPNDTTAADTPELVTTTASTTEPVTESAPAAETTVPEPEKPWYADLPSVKLGETVLHAERVYTMVNLMIADGPLMFFRTSEWLPNFADAVPTLAWSETLTLAVGEKPSVTYSGGTKVSVYGEDYAELAKQITFEELLTRSRSEWKGRTVYLEVGVTFYHALDAEMVERVSNSYFAKTTF